jgi:hypothetical protein
MSNSIFEYGLDCDIEIGGQMVNVCYTCKNGLVKSITSIDSTPAYKYADQTLQEIKRLVEAKHKEYRDQLLLSIPFNK